MFVENAKFLATPEILILWVGQGLCFDVVPGGYLRSGSQGTGMHLLQSCRSEMMGPHQSGTGLEVESVGLKTA